jgi:hypothetical protein
MSENKAFSMMSEARRKAESLMPKPTDEHDLKRELELNRMAIAAKTERLRELRLAREAADKEAGGSPSDRKAKPKRRIKRARNADT